MHRITIFLLATLLIGVWPLSSQEASEGREANQERIDHRLQSLLRGKGSEVMRVPASQEVVNGKGLAPGTLVILEAGQRDVLVLTGFRGSAEKPIIVTNAGGRAQMLHGALPSVKDSQHLRLTGSGQSDEAFGIEAKPKKGMSAIHVSGKSSFIEIDHVFISGAGFGLWSKMNPVRMAAPTEALSSWREFTSTSSRISRVKALRWPHTMVQGLTAVYYFRTN